jgi:hypothetical protein
VQHLGADNGFRGSCPALDALKARGVKVYD